MGASETDGVRGDNFCIPHARTMLRDAMRRYPNKITLQVRLYGVCALQSTHAHSQVSSKGIKLTQVITTVSKSGKLKSEPVKLNISAETITYR